MLKKAKITAAICLLCAILAALFAPLTVSARENGRTVLLDDYYGLCDGNAAQVPGLRYVCSGHSKEMVEYYVEEENEYLRTIPGIIERVGNKIRYVKGYYCPSCYNQFKSGEAQVLHENSNRTKDELGIDGGTLNDYFNYLGEHSDAFLADCGFYYAPKDDFEHIPSNSSGSSSNWKTVAPPGVEITDETILAGLLHSNKALPEPVDKQPDQNDPEGNWDVLGAWTFYQFYYTGMRKIINKPATADDPAWDTVKAATSIYYTQRQKEGETYACRIDYTSHWYNYDYSMLGDWRITDLMAEYATGEICGYATYVGSGTEVAVPETVKIPLYGDVKIIGLDIENHNLQKVYVNDNVTCIRRLSSVNLEEISGCKNLEYIEKYAFQNDVSLKSIPEMPKLDWIAMGAFEGCISLRDIRLPDNITFIDFTAFGWYDTVLGNYDIGMDVESWEAFQYLRDLSDNERILGLNLYAKKGSTTYKLLDTLINKNDALTPALDDNDKPYFKSYGESVAMMSGEVKTFTSHWNLKSSGEYKGGFSSTDKDVDDSTGGRLGEYGKDEPSWSPKQIIKNGGITAGILLVGASAVGVADYKKKKKEEEDNWQLWGISYDQWCKLGSDYLDHISDSLKKVGKAGPYLKAAIAVSKVIQKYNDIYAQTGDAFYAAQEAFASSFLFGQAVSIGTDCIPTFGIWDTVTGLAFGTSTAADATNIGGNAEHLFDLWFDWMNMKNKEDHMTLGIEGTIYSRDELNERILSGAYGENIKNIAAVKDMMNFDSAKDIYNGIFGSEGMGLMQFAENISDSAEHVADGSILLNLFNNAVKNHYSKN